MRHSWNLSPKEAVELQKKLREHISLSPLHKEIRTIAGADVSSNRFSKTLYAGIIVLSYPHFKELDHAVIEMEATMPYIPGLLSFREIPALMKAWDKLKTKPDVLMVDGHGICHPRRLGIATHIGLLLDIPTIGAAKSLLTGTYEELGIEAGSLSYIRDKWNKEEIIGAALRSKACSLPIIISPGNNIRLKESIEIVQESLRGYRLPEPTKKAHELVNTYRKSRLR